MSNEKANTEKPKRDKYTWLGKTLETLKSLEFVTGALKTLKHCLFKKRNTLKNMNLLKKTLKF